MPCGHDLFMAEREGFEPSVPFQVRRFSRPLPSTAQPSLRAVEYSICVEKSSPKHKNHDIIIMKEKYARKTRKNRKYRRFR